MCSLQARPTVPPAGWRLPELLPLFARPPDPQLRSGRLTVGSAFLHTRPKAARVKVLTTIPALVGQSAGLRP